MNTNYSINKHNKLEYVYYWIVCSNSMCPIPFCTLNYFNSTYLYKWVVVDLAPQSGTGQRQSKRSTDSCNRSWAENGLQRRSELSASVYFNGHGHAQVQIYLFLKNVLRRLDATRFRTKTLKSRSETGVAHHPLVGSKRTALQSTAKVWEKKGGRSMLLGHQTVKRIIVRELALSGCWSRPPRSLFCADDELTTISISRLYLLEAFCHLKAVVS